MEYVRRDLQVVDPIAHICSHPQMYFPEGDVDGLNIVLRIVSDILEDSLAGVTIKRLGDWWIIASDLDWFERLPDVTVQDRFTRIIPYPEAGDNAFHAEVLAGAFAQDIVVFEPSQVLSVKGHVPRSDPVFASPSNYANWKRIVAMRFPTPDSG